MTSILAAFDLETTSPKPSTCAAVQVGLVAFEYNDEAEGNLIESVIINEITDPGMESSDGASEVHGITPEMWAGKRPDFVVLGEAYHWMRSREKEIIVIGHNIRAFDMLIINRIVKETDHATYDRDLQVRYIDTLTLARRLLHMAPNGHKLGDLYQWITGNPPVDAHDAVGDCRMVLALVKYFCNALKKTVDELADDCAQVRVLEICTYKKHAGKRWGRGGQGYVPFHYAQWMANNFESPDPDLVATLRHHYNLRFRLA